MKVTQKVIDVARAKLPSRPTDFLSDTEIVYVSSNEIGILDSHDSVHIKFAWKPECRKWVCMTPAVEEPALNVVELKPTTKEPGENVIQRLEQALEMARAGELDNVAIVAVLTNGDVMDAWANGSQPYAIVGGVESLKFEFMTACIEAR